MAHKTPAEPLDPSIAYWLEMAEAHAWADTYTAASEHPGNPTGAVVGSVGSAVALGLTTIDLGFFNRVIGLGTVNPAVEANVDAASRFFADLGVTQSLIHVAPGAHPPEIGLWLGARGYVHGRRSLKTWHDLERVDPPDPDMQIDRIDTDRAALFQDVCSTAFEDPPVLPDVAGATVGRPGWVHYIGYAAGLPVTTGAMRLKAGVAWLGFGATLDTVRGRAWQTAMTLRRLTDARETGAWLAVTETPEEAGVAPAKRLYRTILKTGFKPGYARQDWVRGGG